MKLRKLYGTWSDTKFHGTLVPPKGLSPSSIEFHGILVPPKEISLSSMEFHFKRAPFQMTQVFHGILWDIPWNSIELWYRQMKYSLVTWNSMEYSMEFHGTLVPPNAISLGSKVFHGTLRLSFYSIPCYPGLPWNIPWNSMELWSRQIKKPPSSMESHGTMVPPN